MKKVFIFLSAIILSFSLNAQTNLTEAVDFNTTDSHGNPIHLFEILDKGQAVLIDFFFLNCGDCVATIPYIEESYHAFGCNMHDVFYMEISPYDNDAACQTWIDRYGIEYPTIGTSGGGMDILQAYGVHACPTTVLIMPNRQIVMQDLWPINNTQTVIDALESHGIEQHDCSFNEEVFITPDTLHLYFHGCSPHGEYLSITNNTSEELVINRCYSDNFDVECFDNNGTDIASSGTIIPIGETAEFQVFASPSKAEHDIYGKMIIDTDVGIFSVVLYYESALGLDEPDGPLSLYPNPANDFVIISGNHHGKVCVCNAIGQKIEEFEIKGNETLIPTTHYPNGTYLIKAEGLPTKQVIVRH